HLFAVDGDRHRAVDDDEEIDAAHMALPDDLDPRPERALLEVAPEPPQLALAQPAEERNALELLGRRCHRPILTPLVLPVDLPEATLLPHEVSQPGPAAPGTILPA